jgi:3-methyladenine DNA glycosylase AlkC
MKAKTSFSLKDQLLNPEKVAFLVARLCAAGTDFPADSFSARVLEAFPRLELKERIDHIAECLREALPADYPVALETLLRSLPPELDPTRTDDDFGDFIFAPYSVFVAKYGCSAEHLPESLAALAVITKRFSVEWSIRDFINVFPRETMTFLAACAQDGHYHVRRLASEGTRPKLPWARKLTLDYQAPVPLLNRLFADPTRFVTRSVANHLNDISKIDPELVVTTLTRWRKSGRQGDKEMAYICKHALRTLVKKGYPDALTLLGFGAAPEVEVQELKSHTPVVNVGEAFEFSVGLASRKKQNLVVDYRMDFASAGKKRGQKVFKLKTLELIGAEVWRTHKKHPMRLMTTRRLYVGEHEVTLLINGQAHGSLTFELVNE